MLLRNQSCSVNSLHVFAKLKILVFHVDSFCYNTMILLNHIAIYYLLLHYCWAFSLQAFLRDEMGNEWDMLPHHELAGFVPKCLPFPHSAFLFKFLFYFRYNFVSALLKIRPVGNFSKLFSVKNEISAEATCTAINLNYFFVKLLPNGNITKTLKTLNSIT